MINAEGGKPVALTDGTAEDKVPSWSADGRFVYFSSNRSGAPQIWKVAVSGGEPSQVTQHGGFAAFESSDGRFLYFAKEDQAGIWRMATRGGDEVLILPRPLPTHWGKQFYRYDVKRWLDGDPAQPAPPPQRRGRNAGWLNVDARDILSMPDPWEYPWFAAWDMAFHTVALAHVDPAFAKYQLLVLCREWFQHPNGALPAYEWAFSDANPPVHAWAALHVGDIDGRRDNDFLGRLLPKLLMNFTWWVNRMDPEGDHLFSGGFLGLDNISAIDRSHLPAGGRLEQADGTSWMAFYSLTLLEMARILAEEDDRWTDIEVKFIEHFVLIVDAMHSQGLWDQEDGFFYDVFHASDGTTVPIKVRSIVGVLPLMGMVVLGPELLKTLETLQKRFAGFLGQDAPGAPEQVMAESFRFPTLDAVAVGVIPPREVRRVLARVFDESEFLSPHGLRALSKSHDANPLWVDLAGMHVSVGYEPAESVPACSGATPTGGGRSGCPSTTWCCATCSGTPDRWGRRRRSSTPPGAAIRSRWPSAPTTFESG